MRMLQQFFARLRRWHRRRVAIRELMALPDWALKDIGVMRAEIPAIVDGTLDATTPAATPTTATGAGETPAAQPATEGADKAALAA